MTGVSDPSTPFFRYADSLHDLVRSVEAQGSEQKSIDLEQAMSQAVKMLGPVKTSSSRKIMFIGNGGSAGIASHCAIDYAKNGGIRAMSCNDAAALTCLANDYGYDQVFAKQIEFHGQPGDVLFAISSSGQSQNILNAVETARDKDMRVMTFSGFSCDNALRKRGDTNFYVSSDLYGFVEILHLILIHAMLDMFMGWENNTRQNKETQ